MKYIIRKYGFETQVKWDELNSGKSPYEDIDLGEMDLPFCCLIPGNKIILENGDALEIRSVTLYPPHKTVISCFRSFL